MILGVIPARGGSKRISNKNFRSFCGKPIICYSIDAALKSGVFDDVIVSTDSEQIAGIAKAAGASVPFLRPAELADDLTPTLPVVRHAIESMTSAEEPIEFACCLYATAPFVTAEDIRLGLEKLKQNRDAQFAFTVCRFPCSIYRSLRMEDGRVKMVYPEHETSRSQDLPVDWHDAGQFYWGTADGWCKGSGIFSNAAIGIALRRNRVQDIDTEEDWQTAERMFTATSRPIVE